MCTLPGCARSWKTTRRTRATFIPSAGWVTASRHELVTRGVIREGGGKFTAELLPRTTSVVEWAGKPEKNAPTNGVVAAWKATLQGERHSESRYPGPFNEPCSGLAARRARSRCRSGSRRCAPSHRRRASCPSASSVGTTQPVEQSGDDE